MSPELRDAPQAVTRCPIRFCTKNARPDKGVCEDHIRLLGRPEINALLIQTARRGEAPLYVRESEETIGGMFHTGEEALPEGGDVRVWYEDGDLAATVCGNLALGIDPLEAAEAVLAALRTVKRRG